MVPIISFGVQTKCSHVFSQCMRIGRGLLLQSTSHLHHQVKLKRQSAAVGPGRCLSRRDGALLLHIVGHHDGFQGRFCWLSQGLWKSQWVSHRPLVHQDETIAQMLHHRHAIQHEACCSRCSSTTVV